MLLNDKIENLYNRYHQLIGERDYLRKEKLNLEDRLNELEIEFEYTLQAQSIIQTVALELQNQIKIRIEDIVNLAIDYFFPNEYKFVIDFVVRRNQTECDLLIEKDGERYNPIDSHGGGLVDIISFALRIALWSLKVSKKNNTIILDEPFRFLSNDLQEKAGKFLIEISKKLNIQFIIVTHEIKIMEFADKKFHIGKIDDNSEVIND